MKPHMMENATRRSQWLRRLLCVPAVMLFFAVSARAQTDTTPAPVGGPGGSPFVARCPQGRYLTGFEIRGGALVDAIRPICVVVYGPAEAGPLEPYPSMFGGPGGYPVQLLCPREFPIVKGVQFGWKLRDPAVIQNIRMFCGNAAAGDGKEQFAEGGKGQDFFGSDYSPYILDPDNPTAGDSIQDCDGPQDDFRGTVVGITGRSGEWLDALGVICDKAAEFTPKPVALGRTGATTPAPPLSRIGNEPPICARARDARRRNSPVASALEAQCQAGGGNFVDRKVQGLSGASAPSAIDASHGEIFARSPAEKYAGMHVTGTTTGTGALGALGASHAGASATPPAAPEPDHAFVPPLFDDGARLWACADAADGEANGVACTGQAAGAAYCRAQGFSGALQMRPDGAPGLTLGAVRPENKVRASNGDVCTANECIAVSELHCAP